MRNSGTLPLPLPRVVAGPELTGLRVAVRRANKAAGIALVILACVFWALVLRPETLGGPAGYVLVSGTSMEPGYHTGDLVLVLKRDRYKVGDVIAYRVPESDPMAGAQVIHRIVGGDEKRGFVVQGDNRSSADVWRPTNEDVVGSELVRIPQAILVLQFLRSPVLLGLLAACFVFARLAFPTSASHSGSRSPAPSR